MNLPHPFWTVLQQLLTRLENQQVVWALTGSTNFALQGVPVTPNDIDVQSDADGAYQFEQQFAEYVRNPVTFSATSRIKSHFGSLMIDGIKVEIMGDVQKKVNGVWESPPNLQEHRRYIVVEGYQVPVLDLGYEIEAYRKMGRDGTVELLRPFQQSTS
ncbi:MAG: hypothetical protein GY943_19630 [Chloroflexi bacterium]|nr:hypothetical protein [Chloroflexota bacterium]